MAADTAPPDRCPTVLFDLDGTLTDPAEGITRCLAYALERLGNAVPPSEELRACIGPPLQASFPRLLGSDDPELTRQAVTLYRERFAAVGMYENAVYPGIPEVLTAVRAGGGRLFVATSKPAVYAEKILRHFDLPAFFDGVYGSELTGERSDKAELIAYLLEQEALTAAGCVMVGDRRHDVDGARRNGLFPVGVLWGYGSREELETAGAKLLCAHPGELPGVLLGRAGPR
ncbi:MAG TPA: HAD family hydrolase [Armatimonadaceae bacterium]|nr:HAD family hydrolase [Armatimonadaceae bacterium]